jgi:hypothetical protein
MSDYQKYVTNDHTTELSVLCGHEWHIFSNRTSKLVIFFIYWLKTVYITVYYIDCFEPINLIFSFICIVCVYFFIAH